MGSKITRKFRQLLDDLPAEIRDSANNAYLQFAQDPSHPSLRFKKIHPTEPIFSARVTIDYRAVGVRIDGTMIWFWIGNHTDYDRLLKNL